MLKSSVWYTYAYQPYPLLTVFQNNWDDKHLIWEIWGNFQEFPEFLFPNFFFMKLKGASNQRTDSTSNSCSTSFFTAEGREQEGGARPWSWLRPLDDLVKVCEKFHNINIYRERKWKFDVCPSVCPSNKSKFHDIYGTNCKAKPRPTCDTGTIGTSEAPHP